MKRSIFMGWHHLQKKCTGMPLGKKTGQLDCFMCLCSDISLEVKMNNSTNLKFDMTSCYKFSD